MGDKAEKPQNNEPNNSSKPTDKLAHLETSLEHLEQNVVSKTQQWRKKFNRR